MLLERCEMERDPHMVLTIEYAVEADGRYIAEIPELPGILPAYGATPEEARKRAVALAFFWLADRLEHGDWTPPESVEFRAA